MKPAVHGTLLPRELHPGHAQEGPEEHLPLEGDDTNTRRREIAKRMERLIAGASVAELSHQLSLGEMLVRKAGEVQAENKKVLDRAVAGLAGPKTRLRVGLGLVWIPKRRRTDHRGRKWTMI